MVVTDAALLLRQLLSFVIFATMSILGIGSLASLICLSYGFTSWACEQWVKEYSEVGNEASDVELGPTEALYFEVETASS